MTRINDSNEGIDTPCLINNEQPETLEHSESPEPAAQNLIEAGGIVKGKVVRIKPFGAVIQLPDKSSGLVHISHISPKYVQDVNDFLSVGDIVNVKVISVDKENGKIALSIKDAKQPEIISSRPPRENPVYENVQSSASATFEDKFKDWLKASNEKQAGLNKRNKRR